jgi:hypothetical protein
MKNDCKLSGIQYISDQTIQLFKEVITEGELTIKGASNSMQNVAKLVTLMRY